MPGKVKLDLIAGPMKGRKFVFEEHDTFLLGRSPECQVSLPNDSFVSRYHFILEINPPRVRIRDLGSLNGTFVNGKECGGGNVNRGSDKGTAQYSQMELVNGDRIQVGETIFLLEIETPPTVHRTDRCPACGRETSDVLAEGQRCKACRANIGETKGYPREGVHKATTVRTQAAPSIDGYRLKRKIGQGAMGDVYLAERTTNDERVVLKLLSTQVAVEEPARKRFLREMEILQSLEHPNIVRFMDSGTDGNQIYIAMEYCNKGSVEDLLERHNGRFPFDMAASILKQALEGLKYAHKQEMVHRDIKPCNILIKGRRTRWKAKIGDFGLAKNFTEAGLSGMTATGEHGGTYPYMPREQLTEFKYARPVSDVWSIAATFYRMVTGTFPRDMRDDQDPLEVILSGNSVPIGQRAPDVPPRIANVINKALATNLNDLFPSAVELSEALDAAL